MLDENGNEIASECSAGDILSTTNANVTLLQQTLWVASVAAEDLKGCSWPLLSCMLFGPQDDAEFFTLTQQENELTLIMDKRCYDCFQDASDIARVTYAPRQWRAFELHLASIAAEVPGAVAFLSSVRPAAVTAASKHPLSSCSR